MPACRRCNASSAVGAESEIGFMPRESVLRSFQLRHRAVPPSRGRSFTQVTMCGEMAPHPRLPGFSGLALSQKCPPSSNSKLSGKDRTIEEDARL